MMKYLWKVEIEGPFGTHDRWAVTDNDDPTEAVEVAKKHFTKKDDGSERRIISVTFTDNVYTK